MNILIFLKQVDDVKIPLGYDESTGTVKKDWNVPMLNPEDRAAMEGALELKARLPETRITLVHLGPAAGEQLVRDGLALGCDEGLRVWDDELDDLHVQGKALILARVARILTFDLIFVGARSRDTASSQLGVLLASSLGLPCMTRVIALRVEGTGTVVATRRLAGGYQERVESIMPLVATVEVSEGQGHYATLPAFLAASEREIPCLSFSEIGIPLHLVRETESRLSFGRLSFPTSRLKYIAAPDSSLPAFERREKLREGSMRKRAAAIVRGEADDVAEALFQTLRGEGWLDHLRKAQV
jgi:electron transfer flavoprotein beta subunit